MKESEVEMVKECKNAKSKLKILHKKTINILIHKCNKQYTNKQFAEIRLVHKYQTYLCL